MDGLPIGLGLLIGLHRAMSYTLFDDFDVGDYHGNRWAGASEKSAAASRREDEVRTKFHYLHGQMDLALYENNMTLIGMACHAKSNSPLKLLSNDVMEQVLGFAGISTPKTAGVKSAVAGRVGTGLAIVPFAGWGQKKKKNAPDESQLNLADMSLFQPGSKIVIPLAKPNLHLTGPCYRDLRRHVKDLANWDVQRTAATDAEKHQYKETRKGTVYFINAIYKVPGKVSGKRKRAASSASATVTSGGGKKKAVSAAGGTRKSPPERKMPQFPLSPGTQGKATSALQAAIESATNDVNGKVDHVIFQRALAAGYSKQFVLDKVADHLESIKDTKPPAKKKKAE